MMAKGTNRSRVDEFEDEELHDPPEGERCPICGSWNEPYSLGPTCRHFFALRVDGFFSGGGYDSLDEQLQSAMSGLDYAIQDVASCLKDIPPGIVECRNAEDLITDEAWRRRVRWTDAMKFVNESPVWWAPEYFKMLSVSGCATNGMLSGSAESLYLADRVRFRRFINGAKALANAAERVCGRLAIVVEREERRSKAAMEAAAARNELGLDNLDAACRELPLIGAGMKPPYLVQRWMPAVYGVFVLLFNWDRRMHDSYPEFRVQFKGPLRTDEGNLTPEALDAVVEEMRRFVASEHRGICLVLSSEKALYVDHTGGPVESEPPRGTTRFDFVNGVRGDWPRRR